MCVCARPYTHTGHEMHLFPRLFQRVIQLLSLKRKSEEVGLGTKRDINNITTVTSILNKSGGSTTTRKIY